MSIQTQRARAHSRRHMPSRTRRMASAPMRELPHLDALVLFTALLAAGIFLAAPAVADSESSRPGAPERFPVSQVVVAAGEQAADEAGVSHFFSWWRDTADTVSEKIQSFTGSSSPGETDEWNRK